MDVFNIADDQVLLIPMDGPSIRVDDHMSGDRVPAEQVVPFVEYLNAALWSAPCAHRPNDLIS